MILWSILMAPLSSVWSLALLLTLSPSLAAADAGAFTLVAQTRSDGEKTMNCYISSRKANRENTRTNCVYKCPNGKTEAEVVPKGVSCPPFVNVAK
jgi:hypothetical protein